VLPYQGLAKKYRPRTFSEVLGQAPVVQTIRNALRLQQIGHAYLFCGMRGTGKTTLARLFAKGVNCHNLSGKSEPCGQCVSCRDIQSNRAIHVIEIDGASHRGIDDIRNLNETVIYATSPSSTKVYIIDEVHMLTKEAFNALLKTLEEPPQHVMFFFATTHPEKMPQTILSRCQRFDLQPISPKEIIIKLNYILKDLKCTVEKKALELIAYRADGSLRDGELLLDRLLCLCDGEITVKNIEEALGLPPRTIFFKLDKAASENNLPFAFDLAQEIFEKEIDIKYFLEGLIEHYHTILSGTLGRTCDRIALSPDAEKQGYVDAQALYTKQQVLEILDLLHAQCDRRTSHSFKRVDLEILLLQIIRCMKKISLETLVDQLFELKQSVMLRKVPHTTPQIDKSPILEAKKAPLSFTEKQDTMRKKIGHDKIMHFASVELNGSIKK